MAATLLDATLLALLATVAVTDIRSRRVPDGALLAAVVAALPLLALSDPAGLPDRLAFALGAGGFLLAAALARPEGMGLGDVKLAAVLGLFLGRSVVPALLFALTAGFVAGVALIAVLGWSACARTIPFAPFLALGAVAAMALAQP